MDYQIPPQQTKEINESIIVIDGIKVDLELAIKHVKSDMRDDWFPDPLAYSDILTLENIKNILVKYSAKTYKPDSSLKFNIPKTGYTLRYSMETSIVDKIVYQAFINKIAKKFDSILNSRVYSFRINDSTKVKDRKYFFKKGVNEWKNFNNDVLSEFEESDENTVVLITDITNYYENITWSELKKVMEVLINDIQFETEAEKKVAEQVINKICGGYLYHLSEENTKKGIPQNRDGSSFLANLYLAPIDHEMIQNGYNYFRYADDIKIVCKNKYQARKALRDLIIELRKKGLNVNSGKTYILNFKNDADKLKLHIPDEDPFMEQVEILLKSKVARNIQIAIPMLKTKTTELILNKKTSDRVFKFCINRFEKIARNEELNKIIDFSDIVEAVIKELREQPWSSENLVRFLKAVQLSNDELLKIKTILLQEDSNIYTWQSFHIWHLFVFKSFNDHELVKLSRKVITSGHLYSKPEIAGALIYLGAQGTSNDKMLIIDKFDSFNDFFTQRYALIAVKDLSYNDILKDRVESKLCESLKNSCLILNKKFSNKFFEPPKLLSASELIYNLPEVIS